MVKNGMYWVVNLSRARLLQKTSIQQTGKRICYVITHRVQNMNIKSEWIYVQKKKTFSGNWRATLHSVSIAFCTSRLHTIEKWQVKQTHDNIKHNTYITSWLKYVCVKIECDDRIATHQPLLYAVNSINSLCCCCWYATQLKTNWTTNGTVRWFVM